MKNYADSGKTNFVIICSGDAPPVAWADSIIPSFTSSDNIRSNGQYMGQRRWWRGTIADPSPIKIPTITLVSGITAISRIINGREREGHSQLGLSRGQIAAIG